MEEEEGEGEEEERGRGCFRERRRDGMKETKTKVVEVGLNLMRYDVDVGVCRWSCIVLLYILQFYVDR